MRILLIAFCIGVAWLQQQAALPPPRWLWSVPILLSVLLVPRTVSVFLLALRRAGLIALCAVLGVSWAAWRADLRLQDRLPTAWESVDIDLTGVVSDLPRNGVRGTRFLMDVERVHTPGAPPLKRVQLMRYARGAKGDVSAPRAGERWRATVRLKRPHGTHNPHGFDLEAWMLERGIAGSGYVRGTPAPQRLDALAATPTAWVAATRAAVRERVQARIGSAPYAGVIVALVIGDQRSIPHEQWRAFTRTGVNHLLSISGLHVTMIASLAGWLVAMIWRRLPAATERLPSRQAGLLAAVVAASLYAVLAGFQIPAQRTLFMLLVVAASLWGRREPQPFTALVWALFLVLLIDPWAVLSAGFWLSFGAMAAILWVTFGRVQPPSAWRGWMTVQAAVTLGLAPVLFLMFQQVSLVSPLANAVAVPVVSWLVTPLALLGTIAPPLWQLAAWLMAGLGAALSWAGDLPGAIAVLPAASTTAVALALLGTAWLLLPRGFPLRAMGLVLWLPLIFPHVPRVPAGALHLAVLDVGQGTAILIRTAGHTLLYDTGAAFADSDSGERIIAPYLRASGIGTLSGIIVSHDDNDHSGGLKSVLRDVPTGWVLHGLPATSPLLRAAPSPRSCHRGQHWQWDGIRFEILNPKAEAYAQSNRRDNDYSCVLKITRGTQSVLLTGDAERRGELELLESGADLAATVLVAGHHGSRTSSLADFIAQVQPTIGVFTVGYRNRFNHPHPQVLRRFREAGSQILRSDRSGLIAITFGEAGVKASEYRPTHRRYWQDS